MSLSPSHVAMADADLKRTASELDEPASGSEDPESSSALSSHPAKRRYIDQSHAEGAQPTADAGSHTTIASSPITVANGLSNHQQRQFQNGDPSTTHAPPLSGPSTNHLESPGRLQVPEALDEDRLRGMEPGDLVQTILELQSAYEHNMSIVSAQYEDVSRQLAEIRACLSTLLKGSTESLEAASRVSSLPTRVTNLLFPLNTSSRILTDHLYLALSVSMPQLLNQPLTQIPGWYRPHPYL